MEPSWAIAGLNSSELIPQTATSVLEMRCSLSTEGQKPATVPLLHFHAKDSMREIVPWVSLHHCPHSIPSTARDGCYSQCAQAPQEMPTDGNQPKEMAAVCRDTWNTCVGGVGWHYELER